MEKYTDHGKWLQDKFNLEAKLKEHEYAKPLYYIFFEEMVELVKDKWMKTKTVYVSGWGDDEREVSVFMDYMKKWNEFPYDESQKIWDEVKVYNKQCASYDKFNTKLMYEKMKGLKAEKSKEITNATNSEK